MSQGKHHAEAIKRLHDMMKLLDDRSNDEQSFDELCKAIVIRKNKECALRFSEVPFHKRIVFLPQCLRRPDRCKAKEDASGYICAECGACAINTIIKNARRLCYAGVYVLKGGRAVVRILDEQKPLAVVGVACQFEGALGVMECEKKKIPVQFVALSTDGCFQTEVDLEEVESVLNYTDICKAEHED